MPSFMNFLWIFKYQVQLASVRPCPAYHKPIDRTGDLCRHQPWCTKVGDGKREKRVDAMLFYRKQKQGRKKQSKNQLASMSEIVKSCGKTRP